MVVLQIVVRIFVFLQLVVHTFELLRQRHRAVVYRIDRANFYTLDVLLHHVEEESGHVHKRSHRVHTRGFLHQPCASLVASNRLVPQPVLPPSVREISATSTHAARPRPRTQPPHPRTQLLLHQPCAILSASSRIILSLASD